MTKWVDHYYRLLTTRSTDCKQVVGRSFCLGQILVPMHVLLKKTRLMLSVNLDYEVYFGTNPCGVIDILPNVLNNWLT